MINMVSKEEKKRRAALVEAQVQKDTENAIEKMPISFSVLAELFDHLDVELGEQGCDHTSKITQQFLKERNLNLKKILSWLEEFGGYCDCEVLANVEESWESEIKKHL